MDAIASSVDDDTVAWHRNDGRGVFTKVVLDRSLNGAYWTAPVDMNGDGRLDLLGAGKVGNTVALYTRN